MKMRMKRILPNTQEIKLKYQAGMTILAWYLILDKINFIKYLANYFERL